LSLLHFRIIRLNHFKDRPGDQDPNNHKDKASDFSPNPHQDIVGSFTKVPYRRISDAKINVLDHYNPSKPDRAENEVAPQEDNPFMLRWKQTGGFDTIKIAYHEENYDPQGFKRGKDIGHEVVGS
jgi:hypothetical protein